MDNRTFTVLILVSILCGCAGNTNTTTTTTLGGYVYCDANEPCEVGDCYLFPNMSYPICYLGNPCNWCPQKSCRIAESYPMQVFCGLGEETVVETKAECGGTLDCDGLPNKVDRIVCLILKAKVSSNETICKRLQGQDFQEVCYLIIRAQKHGPNSCDSIPDMYWKHMCYEWVTAEQGGGG